MSKSKEKILEKIKKRKIEKLPRWSFVLRRVGVWILLVFAVLLMSVSVSMVMFNLSVVDWDVYPRMGKGVFGTIFTVMPYFWIILSILLFGFVYYDFKNTKKGYRYGAISIVGFSFLVSLFLGFLLHRAQVSNRVDDYIGKFPVMMHLQHDRAEIWRMPEEGFLGGVIVEFDDGKMIILDDFMQNRWDVDISEVEKGDNFVLRVGDRIKAIGEVVSEGEFFAEEIRPWQKGGRMPLKF